MGFGTTRAKLHLRRLVEWEYVVAHRARHAQQVTYELVYTGEGQDGERFVPSLFDPSGLANLRDDQRELAAGTDWSGAGRPLVGDRSRPGRVALDAATLDPGNTSALPSVSRVEIERPRSADTRSHQTGSYSEGPAR